jgi:hypothetical protein
LACCDPETGKAYASVSDVFVSYQAVGERKPTLFGPFASAAEAQTYADCFVNRGDYNPPALVVPVAPTPDRLGWCRKAAAKFWVPDADWTRYGEWLEANPKPERHVP